jgi:hypothetical protein
MAPNAARGASRMIQPMIVKNNWLMCSINSKTTGGPCSPNFASARPNRTAKKSTCSSWFSANAEITDVGMMLSRNCTVCGSSPSPVFFATASAPVARVCGSMLKPAPGLTMLPITNPNSSANVVTTSK